MKPQPKLHQFYCSLFCMEGVNFCNAEADLKLR